MQRAVVLAAVLLAACGSQESWREPGLGSSEESSSSVSATLKRDKDTTVCREDDDDDDDVECDKDDDKDHDGRRDRHLSRRGDDHGDQCKVRICHGPAGQQNTIRVSTRALKAHLKHGDHVGKCLKCPPPPPICPPPACVPQGGTCRTNADCCVQANPLFCQTGAGFICAPAG